MKTWNAIPKKQIFVCCNDRPDDKCCAKVNGLAIFQELKSFAKENNLPVRVTKTGCMGQCSTEGVTLAIYPEMTFLNEVRAEDLSEIKKKMSTVDL